MTKAKIHLGWRDIFRKSKRKIEITTETKKTLKIIRKTERYKASCSECLDEAVFLSVTQMANIFNVEIEFLELFIKEKNVHIIKFDDLETVICLKSLISEMDNKISDF